MVVTSRWFVGVEKEKVRFPYERPARKTRASCRRKESGKGRSHRPRSVRSTVLMRWWCCQARMSLSCAGPVRGSSKGFRSPLFEIRIVRSWYSLSSRAYPAAPRRHDIVDRPGQVIGNLLGSIAMFTLPPGTISPESGTISPASSFIRVDLPDPLRPRRPILSPGSIWSVTQSRSRGPPKLSETSCMRISPISPQGL